MKKRLLMLSLVSLLTFGVTSCGVTARSVDGEEVIVTIGDKNYTASQLLEAYGKTSNGVSSYYDAIYNALIYSHYDELINDNLKTNIESDVDSFTKQVKTDAASNGVTYNSQLTTSLENEGCETLDEYRQKCTLKRLKTAYEDQYYTKNDNKNFNSLRSSYIEEKNPYHIKHILVKSDTAGTSLYKGCISESEARKLSTTIQRLAKGNENFGQIAQEVSEDNSGTDSSASLYGSLGIMDMSTSFVNEFKLGIYSYDTLLDTHTGVSNSDRQKRLSIPEKINSDESLLTYDVDDVVTGAMATVPFSAVLNLEKYADKTLTINNVTTVPTTDYGTTWAGATIDETFYPRNVLFNNYFNNHGIYFVEITDTTTYPRYTALTINGATKNVLCDENSNPIIFTRAGSGDSYQGVHMMVIEQSPFWYASSKLKTAKDTSWQDGTKTPTVDEYLEYYYSTDNIPNTNDDVSKDQRFITFISSTYSTYDKRATKIKDAVKGYDSNIQYKIYKDLLENSTYATIDPTIKANIDNWIKVKEEQAEVTNADSITDSWTTYCELLTLQKEEKAAKQLTTNFIKLYDASYSD